MEEQRHTIIVFPDGVHRIRLPHYAIHALCVVGVTGIMIIVSLAGGLAKMLLPRGELVTPLIGHVLVFGLWFLMVTETKFKQQADFLDRDHSFIISHDGVRWFRLGLPRYKVYALRVVGLTGIMIVVALAGSYTRMSLQQIKLLTALIEAVLVVGAVIITKGTLLAGILLKVSNCVRSRGYELVTALIGAALVVELVRLVVVITKGTLDSTDIRILLKVSNYARSRSDQLIIALVGAVLSVGLDRLLKLFGK